VLDDDRAEDARGDAGRRDDQRELDIGAAVADVGDRAAYAVRKGDDQRNAGGLRGRKAERQPQDRDRDEGAAQSDDRSENPRNDPDRE
jgi:hypothetical protein